jgi:hypothetical protein
VLTAWTEPPHEPDVIAVLILAALSAMVCTCVVLAVG